MGLKDQAISGTSWSLAGQIVRTLSSFIIGIILARLLKPEEYGLLGMATVFVFVTYVFVNSGFSTALVQRPKCSSADYSTIFYINLAISLLFFSIIFFSSGLIAEFYDEPELKNIVRALATLIILYALTLVHQSIISRELKFKLLNLITISSQILSGLIGILLAYKGFGVWSLVWKTLLNQVFITIQYWIFNKWYPTLEFSINSLRQMFTFGSKLLLSGIINNIYERLYTLVIGKFFSAYDLGLYTRAKQFADLPSQGISGAIMSVSFPVFAKMQKEPLRLKSAAKKFIKITMFVNAAAMFGMAAVSNNLIITLVGEKWVGATVYLQLLCISGFLYPLHPINLNIITSIGRSDLFLRLEIFKKLLAIPVVLIGIFTSVKILLIGAIISSIIAIYINSYYSKQLINYGLVEQFKDVSGSLLLGLGMGAIVFFVGHLIKKLEIDILILVIQVLTGVIVSILIAFLFKMEEFYELKSIIFIKLLKKH